ncbi:non-atpase subunit of the 26s proteasome [Stylonychia lemnae]|uniref:Non-atpase subunit of the 26s proteasome n=1 Tax=Stylonychia lemnae TaxID=5949 RepID=A0A078BB21_STYLE|nr:non-atpase subunit of the 26s proteasome [Stylonychia lemnae]|eukprot:CDW90763.1 non-atpase subunit of the 26s proteasome [Stylonychia lemnae]
MYQKIIEKQSAVGLKDDIRPQRLWKLIVAGNLENAKLIFEKVLRKNSEISLQSGEFFDSSTSSNSSQDQMNTSIEKPLNKFGWTALHAACFYGQIAIVQYLVEQLNADVNNTNQNGWNSLIFAIFGGHLDVIDYLLYETPIRLDLLDKQNMDALTISKEIDDQEVVDLIQEKLERSCDSYHNLSYESLLKSLEEY